MAFLSSDSARFTDAQQAALRYAELFVTDHFATDDDVFADLGRHFTTRQIVELVLKAQILAQNSTLWSRSFERSHDWESAVPRR